MPEIRPGTRVRVVDATYGWGEVDEDDVGIVSGRFGADLTVDFPSMGVRGWQADISDVRPVKETVKKEKRAAEILEPKTKREVGAVRLIRSIVGGPGKWTAIKLESEGCLERTDRCGRSCSRRDGKPHVGCKYFSDTKVANDFILRELAKHGLAQRKPGGTSWSYLYAPKAPLVFSRVYTDSETEWTTTLSIEKPEDALYAPILVDAWNALAKANGNGIDVSGSGMHTALLQGKDGLYPSGVTKVQYKMFDNFARSMRPLLPALYLLGASRVEGGRGVTRSTSPRQPAISSSDKYSAIAYRQGALEFRVFDTCYEKRDQVLDNIVVIAQSVNKYWHKKYVRPNVNFGKVAMFGNSDCDNSSVNRLEKLYCLKEHVVMLNSGLRCIKPPYLSVKDIKEARKFALTVRDVKNALDIEGARGDYEKHISTIKVDQARKAIGDLYKYVDRLHYGGDVPENMDKVLVKFHATALRKAKKLLPEQTIEQIAYRRQFGTGFPIGGK